MAARFGMSAAELAKYDALSKEDLLKSYTMMQLCRQFENACNQAYMQVRWSPQGPHYCLIPMILTE